MEMLQTMKEVRCTISTRFSFLFVSLTGSLSLCLALRRFFSPSVSFSSPKKFQWGNLKLQVLSVCSPPKFDFCQRFFSKFK